MKFGIMNLFPLAEGASERLIYEETLEEASLADTLGFDSFWLAEHHFSTYGVLGNPLMFGAAIAQRTKKIKIGTAVMVIPFYDPIRLAEDAALLDNLSEGRLILGTGSGYQPKEFEGFNIEPDSSKERYNEIIEILRLAWSEEKWSYEGHYYQYKEMSVHPRPIQNPLPILHAAVSPESFSRLGNTGERLITSPNFTPLERMKKNFSAYTDALISAGLRPDEFERPFMQQVWSGSDEKGKKAAAEAALRYYQMVGKVIPGQQKGLNYSDQEKMAYYAKVKRGIDLLTLEDTLIYGGNFGNAQFVIDSLKILEEEMGVDHYIGWFRIPTIDRQQALDAMQYFSEEVMPEFAESSAEEPIAVSA